MPIFDVRCSQGHAGEFIGTSAQIAAHRCDCGATVARIWGRPRTAVQADDVPGGFWIENMTPRPLYFRTKSAWKKKMRNLGLVNKVYHVTGDTQVAAWGGIDPQTMANAVALVQQRP